MVSALQAKKQEHENMAAQRDTQIRALQAEVSRYAATNKAWEAWSQTIQGQQDYTRKNEELIR